MTRDASPRRAILAVTGIFLGFGALMAAAAWSWLGPARAERARAVRWTAAPRTQTDEVAVRELVRDGDHVVWQLGGGLATAPVYDIAPTREGDGAWLGTGLGLVRLREGAPARRYRHFPEAPREWARHVTVTDHGIALTLAVASGNTGGSPTGTWLFDPHGERFERIGEPSRALAWNGSALYGIQERSLVRFVRDPSGWRAEPTQHEPKICRTAELAAAPDALWITGQGMVRTGAQSAREVPCGVARLEPGGDVSSWDEDDGLASGFGRDVVTDGQLVVVSHGIQGDGLSLAGSDVQHWRRLRGANGIRLNANALALSPAAIWLATPDGRRPFVRYDRLRGEAHRVDAVPDDHWVRALAGDRDGAWAAFVRERWERGEPQVETWVVRMRDATGPGSPGSQRTERSGHRSAG